MFKGLGCLLLCTTRTQMLNNSSHKLGLEGGLLL